MGQCGTEKLKPRSVDGFSGVMQMLSCWTWFKPTSQSCDLFVLQIFCKLLGVLLVFKKVSFVAIGLPSELCKMQISCSEGRLEVNKNVTVIAFAVITLLRPICRLAT